MCIRDRNEGCNELSNNDSIMKSLINKFNDNKLSSIRNPFYSLCKSIVGQQISVAAASAVWDRLENKYNIFDGQFFKPSDFNQLKKIGLSERKSLERPCTLKALGSTTR